MRSRNLALFTISIIVLTSIVVYSADAAGIPKKAISTVSKFLESDLPTTTLFTDQSSTIAANHQFGSSNLLVENPAKTNAYTIAGGAISTNRTLNLPVITADDTLVTLAATQALTGKTMDGGSNTFTNIPKSALPGTTVYTDQASTMTTNHQFGSSNLLIENPAKTNAYTITGGAISTNRTLNLPVITVDDTFDILGLAQTFTAAKTFPASGIILGGTGAGLGTLTYASSGTSGTVTIPAGTDTLGALGKTQSWTGNNTMKFGSGGIIVRNPASTFTTTISNSAIAANHTLSLPVITSDDTLAALKLAQTWGAKQTFPTASGNAGVNFGGLSSNPSSLSAGDLWRNTSIDSLMLRGASSSYTILSNHTLAQLYNPGTVTFSVTSNSILMMGLASTSTSNPLTFTPTSTGRVLVMLSAVPTDAANNANIVIQFAYGTGTPPNNGAAATGTTIGTSFTFRVPTANTAMPPISLPVIITGLTPGTTYWLDLQATTANKAFTISNVQVTIDEI